MPKIRCICDNVISLSGIPSENQWMIISDVELEKLGDEIELDTLYQKMDIVAKCSDCGRLHIFWKGCEKEQTIYRLEKYN
jgi:hypothetical protein